jgi:outer membrane protein assembly factor BamB
MRTQLTLVACLLLTGARADDWPQYHGAASNRVAAGPLKLADIPAGGGPRILWRVETNTGFGSFVVAGERVFTLVRRTLSDVEREVCLALDASTGRELWAAPLAESAYDGGGDSGADGNKGGDGPRSTPSVAEGRVHVYDAQMVLHTLDVATGEELWRQDVQAQHGGRPIKWQNGSSPLVDGGRVLVCGGGAGRTFLAFDAATGELRWAAGDERMTHATPVVAELHGVRQVIFFVQSGLVALDVESGAELWRADYPYRTSSAASPVVHGDVVYCSAGYGVGAGAFRIKQGAEGFAAELLWQQRNKLMNHWSTPVCKDGFLYGMFGFKKYGEAPLQCVELLTGEVRWSRDGFGPGNVILVGGHLVALGDAGQVVVVDADPDEYRERVRAEVLEGKCWSSPAFAGDRVFVRSTREGVCLDLR